MKRIDLDDVPPKIAALLAEIAPGEEVILVQNAVVVGRLTGAEVEAPTASPEPDTDVDLEARAQEIFEQFRASIEDEF